MGRRDLLFLLAGAVLGAAVAWPRAWGSGFEVGQELAEAEIRLAHERARAEELRAEGLRQLERLAVGFVPAPVVRVSAGSCSAGGAP